MAQPEELIAIARALHSWSPSQPTGAEFLAQQKRKCFWCFKDSENLVRCSRCSIAAYCGPDCQKSDWKAHKVFCPTSPPSRIGTEAVQKLLLGSKAPSIEDVAKVFGAYLARDKNTGALRTLLQPRALHSSVSKGAYLSQLDLIRSAGGALPVVRALDISHATPAPALRSFIAARLMRLLAMDGRDYFLTHECLSTDTYEVVTREYAMALVGHLAAALPPQSGGAKRTVLEVGAGVGRLTHFLKEAAKASAPHLRFVATDSFSALPKFQKNGRQTVKKLWGYDVEVLGFEEALKSHSPDAVVVAWMPAGQDWSWAFRACSSVREYVIIGPVDCTGHLIDTHGLYLEGGDPAWKKDGFVCVGPVEPCEKVQICRNDVPTEDSNSRTIAYRRS